MQSKEHFSEDRPAPAPALCTVKTFSDILKFITT